MNKQEIMTMRNSIPYNERMLTPSEIAAMFDISSTTVYRSILSHPDFPAPVKIPGGPKRWNAGEVKAFCDRFRQKTKC